MRLRLVLVLALAAAVGGCGDSQSSGGSWLRHDIPEGGSSVSLPSDWKVLSDFDAKTIADFSKESPQYARFVKPLAENDAFKLFAIDPHIEKAFATNLNVIVAPVNVPLREWVTKENMTTRGLAVDGSLRSTFVRLPAGPAGRVSWQFELRSGAKSRTTSEILQFLLRHDNEGYVLTYTTLPSLAAKHRPTFIRSARSFRFD